MLLSGGSVKVRRWKFGVAALSAAGLWLFLALTTLFPGLLPTREIIPRGTVVTVRVAQALTSRSARHGDVFEAYVISTEGMDGAMKIPPGARVEGRCVAVRKGQGEGRPGYLRLALSGFQDADGHLSPLETTTFSQWGKSTVETGRGSTAAPSAERASARTALQVSAKSEGNPDEAVVTPRVALRFVLLKPATVAARR